MVKPVLFYALFNPSARAVLLTIKLLGLDAELRFEVRYLFFNEEIMYYGLFFVEYRITQERKM